MCNQVNRVVHNGYKVLYISQDALLYKNFKIYNTEGLLFAFPSISFIKKIASHFRLLVRLLRLEPRVICRINESNFLCSLNNKIWLFDTQSKSLVDICNNRQGWSNPLNFCKIEDRVYWGDYGANPHHVEVNIYRFYKGHVDVIYSFPSNTIRHIHNIVYDISINRVWVLTGDNERQAGIYYSDDEFLNVNCVATGMQLFRAVVAFPFSGGLLYASDSVEEENNIYLFHSTGITQKLSALNGSVIYGVEKKDYFVFSTTVEPKEGSLISKIFYPRLGGGIKSDDVHLITVKKDNLEIKVLRSWKKDFWNIGLFQYGAITFPIQSIDDNKLYFYPIACRGGDGNNFVVNL